MKILNAKILWALSPEAKTQLEGAQAQGWDLDLALACLEILWPEERIYSLGDGHGLDDDGRQTARRQNRQAS